MGALIPADKKKYQVFLGLGGVSDIFSYMTGISPFFHISAIKFRRAAKKRKSFVNFEGIPLF